MRNAISYSVSKCLYRYWVKKKKDSTDNEKKLRKCSNIGWCNLWKGKKLFTGILELTKNDSSSDENTKAN